MLFSWCIILHSFFCVCVCVCTQSGVITSCLSWLEMVSLIPLHHMSGFICILCQELMEFLHGSLWKSLKTPNLMWCVYSRQHYCFWLICCLFVCSMVVFVSVHFVIFSHIWIDFWMKYHFSFLVCMFQELPLHTTASIKLLRCPPFVTLFFLVKWNGKRMVPWYCILYVCCKQCLL